MAVSYTVVIMQEGGGGGLCIIIEWNNSFGLVEDIRLRVIGNMVKIFCLDGNQDKSEYKVDNCNISASIGGTVMHKISIPMFGMLRDTIFTILSAETILFPWKG